MSFIKLPSGNFINTDKIAYIDIGTVVHSMDGRYIRKINDGEPVYAFFSYRLRMYGITNATPCLTQRKNLILFKKLKSFLKR